VIGLKEHSTAIEFTPGKVTGGSYQFNVGTAGSITLVFQACILPALYADRPTTITVTGGTDVSWSPPWNYFAQVFLPLLSNMGVSIEGTLHQRGYYPKGGGQATISVAPGADLHPPTVIDAALTHEVTGTIHLSCLPDHIAIRTRQAAQKILASAELTGNITIDRTVMHNHPVLVLSCGAIHHAFWVPILSEKKEFQQSKLVLQQLRCLSKIS